MIKKPKQLGYKDKLIGALWIKKSQNDNNYYVGKIMIGGMQTKIMILKNNYYKEGTRYPFFNILIDDNNDL